MAAWFKVAVGEKGRHRFSRLTHTDLEKARDYAWDRCSGRLNDREEVVIYERQGAMGDLLVSWALIERMPCPPYRPRSRPPTVQPESAAEPVVLPQIHPRWLGHGSMEQTEALDGASLPPEKPMEHPEAPLE